MVGVDEGAFWVEEPPEFEYVRGMFHIRQRYSEHCVIERVMPPHVFLAALRGAAEAAHKHKFGVGEVIAVDFDSKFERVYRGGPAA